MTKRIHASEETFREIRDTSGFLPRVDPARVKDALGAEEFTASLTESLAPVTLFAVRQELARRLQSDGGRTAPSSTPDRSKIPLSDDQWARLEELAAAIASPGFSPSGGQVASVLLSLSLNALAGQNEALAGQNESEPSSRIAHELQGLTKRCT
jgi:hypothetical protein